MATPGPLASSEEKTNGAKLSRLIIDGGTTVMRNVFDTHHPPAKLAADLNACYSILNNLLRRRILNGHQWDKLFPGDGAAPDSNTFDITLLFLLLTNICGLTPPHTGWHHKPPPTDTSHEANLARIKFFRNQVYGHVTTTGVDAPTFNTLWEEISPVLVSLGLSQPEIDRLKAERCAEEDYLDALRDWAESERDLKSRIDDVHRIVTEIRETQHDTDQEDNIRKKLARIDTQHDVRDTYKEPVNLSLLKSTGGWMMQALQIVSWCSVEMQGWGNLSSLLRFAEECKKLADWPGAIFVTMTEHATGIPR